MSNDYVHMLKYDWQTDKIRVKSAKIKIKAETSDRGQRSIKRANGRDPEQI